MMRTVLFVDDDPLVLEGLRRLLRPERNQLQVFTATSGADAIGFVRATPVDVVVSDLRMPDMDGETLLSRVAACCPQATRVILSGTTEPRGRSIAHHVIDKPCTKSSLLAAILPTAECSLT